MIRVTSREVIQRIRKLDPAAMMVGQVGSHQKWRTSRGCLIVVPVHGGRDIPPGTLASIGRQGEQCFGKSWLRRAGRP